MGALVLTTLLTVTTAAACSDDSDSDNGAGDAAGSSADNPGQSVDDPDAGTGGGNATLRRIGSCDEVAAVLGDYISGFGPGTTGFNIEDQRYDCPWKREPDPEGERIYAVAVSGIYTNTPDFADNNWEVAGLEVLEDQRVESFGGILLLQDLTPVSRTVMIEAPGFSLQLSTNGRDPDYLPIDEMTNLMLELIDH